MIFVRKWCVLMLALTLYSQSASQRDQTATTTQLNSTVRVSNGHYPYYLCHITQVLLNRTDGAFYIWASDDVINTCRESSSIWTFIVSDHAVECDVIYDVGYSFPIFYLRGGISNYYHLHYDMMLPLYKSLYHEKDQIDALRRVLLPLAESSRLQHLDWNTEAFMDDTKYWMQTIQTMADVDVEVLPLDKRLREAEQTVCFKNLYFGTERVQMDDKYFINSFVNFVKRKLNIDETLWKKERRPRVGLISRKVNKRAILNEAELVAAVAHLTQLDLIQFEGWTFRQQVQCMQLYDVVIGVNGAGLMNGLYLPAHGVVVQLVPYDSQVNHVQYGKLLAARGPYIVWHNKHAHLTKEFSNDPYKNKSNTIVKVDEFVALVEKALAVAARNKNNAKESDARVEL